MVHRSTAFNFISRKGWKICLGCNFDISFCHPSQNFTLKRWLNLLAYQIFAWEINLHSLGLDLELFLFYRNSTHIPNSTTVKTLFYLSDQRRFVSSAFSWKTYDDLNDDVLKKRCSKPPRSIILHIRVQLLSRFYSNLKGKGTSLEHLQLKIGNFFNKRYQRRGVRESPWELDEKIHSEFLSYLTRREKWKPTLGKRTTIKKKKKRKKGWIFLCVAFKTINLFFLKNSSDWSRDPTQRRIVLNLWSIFFWGVKPVLLCE